MNERIDVNIKDVVNTKASESYVVINEYPDIDYVLVYRGGTCQPWVAAWGYNKEKSYWNQGHYFNTLEDAIEYIRFKQGIPNWHRMSEIASKAIDGLIEDDPYEAETYLSEEVELSYEECVYFGIDETLDMVKGYKEEDEE